MGANFDQQSSKAGCLPPRRLTADMRQLATELSQAIAEAAPVNRVADFPKKRGEPNLAQELSTWLGTSVDLLSVDFAKGLHENAGRLENFEMSIDASRDLGLDELSTWLGTANAKAAQAH